MNHIEIDRALRKLRLSGIANTLDTRLVQAQSEQMAHLDFLSVIVNDELVRRQDRLIERRIKNAAFRDAHRSLDNFDFKWNPKMDRTLVFELASGRFIEQREDALFLGPPGTGKSYLASSQDSYPDLNSSSWVHPAPRGSDPWPTCPRSLRGS